MGIRAITPGWPSRAAVAMLSLLLLFPTGLWADKTGLGTHAQDRSTCLPYAGANLIYGFAQSGFPNLLPPGKSDEVRFDKLARELIKRSEASYEQGTQTKIFAPAVEQYIRDCGYFARVTQRGIYLAEPLTLDWLKGNNSYLRGFVLAVHTVTYVPGTSKYTFTNNDVGHAVTLVSVRGNSLRINDSAHYTGGNGEKLIQLQRNFAPMDSSIMRRDAKEVYTVTGELDLQEKRPNTMLILCEAICIEIALNEKEYTILASKQNGKSAAGSEAQFGQAPGDAGRAGAGMTTSGASPTDLALGMVNGSDAGKLMVFGGGKDRIWQLLAYGALPLGLVFAAWRYFGLKDDGAPEETNAARALTANSGRGALFAPPDNTGLPAWNDAEILRRAAGGEAVAIGSASPALLNVYRRQVHQLFTERYQVDISSVAAATEIINASQRQGVTVEDCARLIVAECGL